jgi:heptosyltransferase-2
VFEREPVFDLKVSDERKEKAKLLLQTNGVSDAKKIIALCPGSTNSRAKRWQAESYAALADMLIEKLDASVALIGAKEEEDVSNEVARKMKQTPVFLTGKTSLDDAVSVLSLADALVTNDTGPAHIAAALGTPTFVIFGPTIPETTRPFPSNAEVIRKPPDCAPCMLRDCPIDHRCMTAIKPEEVFERVKASLKL